MKSIIEALGDRIDNRILPFFWQHGESEEVLREEMRKIHECGIGAVCVEARPHPDFAGPLWWRDMDIIMDEARNRGMRVWVLDDAHFPTGFANGRIRDEHPEKGKRYLFFRHADVCGPMPSAQLPVSGMAKMVPMPFIKPGVFGEYAPDAHFDDDALTAVIAVRMGEGNETTGESIDLTDSVVDGTLEWDVPAGTWRVFVVFTTRNGGGHPHYINIIDGESVQVLIDAVYQPHYDRYKGDFGGTFAGFFSDEPSFGNTKGYHLDERIGHKPMPLPWSHDMDAMMAAALGPDWLLRAPDLWFPHGDGPVTARTRYAYMDAVTRLYRDNFCRRLGNWCAERGVGYIGHIIEDNNQDTRLGCGVGHFFRAVDGQHMSGIDDIGNQVMFGGERHERLGWVKGDGAFYHHVLGKLGSSAAHIDPRKNGRTMCEIFGAYGWNLGVRHMKWLTDHFLVRGVNHLVPHAFSAKDYPDPDCPPHFYARGNNPQFAHFGHLMRYANRMCHVLSGGTHVAPVALLYHAEALWTGDAMLMQEPARVLLEAQIDFDILPSDVFGDDGPVKAALTHEGLLVNDECHRCLIVPRTEFVTADVARFAAEAQAKGFPVVFLEALPKGICDVMDADSERELIAGLQGCTVLALGSLTDWLTGMGIEGIRLSEPFPMLRYLHYRKDGGDLVMVSNEDTTGVFEGWVRIPAVGHPVLYDAMDNRLMSVGHRPDGDGTLVRISLSPYESVVVAFGGEGWYDGFRLAEKPAVDGYTDSIDLSKGWDLSLSTALGYPEPHETMHLDTLVNVGGIRREFAGIMRYEKSFMLESVPETAVLELEHVYETMDAWVNGRHAGTRITPPYTLDLSGLLVSGRNTLRIEVANTPARDAVNQRGNSEATFVQFIEPAGMFGKVTLHIG